MIWEGDRPRSPKYRTMYMFSSACDTATEDGRPPVCRAKALSLPLRRDRRWLFAANIFHGIIGIKEYNLGLVHMGCFRGEMNKPSYDK